MERDRMHTHLAPDAAWADIRSLLENTLLSGGTTVCIPPCHVHKAADYVERMLRIFTVIGYPYGFTTTRTKVYEASEAITDGADGILLSVNRGWMRDGRYGNVLAEIQHIKDGITAVNPKAKLYILEESERFTEDEREILANSAADGIFSVSNPEFVEQ